MATERIIILQKSASIVMIFLIIIFVIFYYQGEDKFVFEYDIAEYRNQSYVLGWGFNEGQTSASRNLLGLVHWASTIKFYVVEPCIHDSFLNMSYCFNESVKNDSLNFRDYIDLDHWNQQVLLHNYGKPLAPWKQFINNLPHQAIVVYLWRKKGTRGSFVNTEIADNPGCYSQIGNTRPQFVKSTLVKLGINIVREVCIHFNNFQGMDVRWFNAQVLGDYRPPNILILFVSWPGSFQGGVYFSDTSLSHNEAYDFIKPSQRVVEDSRKYKDQFLGDNYVAVAIRTAKLATWLAKKHKSPAKITHFLTETCPREVSLALEKVSGRRMLALDLGRFGDRESFDIEHGAENKIVPKFLNIVYGNKWNWTEWENSFVHAAGGITDTGYIALLQKTLVTNATCLIISGRGQFQTSLIKAYKARVKYPCIHQVCKV